MWVFKDVSSHYKGTFLRRLHKSKSSCTSYFGTSVKRNRATKIVAVVIWLFWIEINSMTVLVDVAHGMGEPRIFGVLCLMIYFSSLYCIELCTDNYCFVPWLFPNGILINWVSKGVLFDNTLRTRCSWTITPKSSRILLELH